jgi:hypothetical protein
MAIHKKRQEANPAAVRLLLESPEPVELPPATVEETGATLEREAFRSHLPELFAALGTGSIARPAPLVQSESVFVIEGQTRSFWVRLWHTDGTRTHVDRLHVLSCLPRMPSIKINLPGLP